MSAGTLYTPPKYYRAYRIQIAAALSGTKLSLGNRSDAPCKEESNLVYYKDSKVELFEANAIAAYVGNNELLRATEPQVIQWCIWSDLVIVPAVGAWVYPCLGATQCNHQQMEKAKKTIQEAMQKLNSHLETRTFLVGERMSQADVTVACNSLLLFENVFDAKVREGFPHVTRWFSTVMNQPAALGVIGGSLNLCNEELKVGKGGNKGQGGAKGGKGQQQGGKGDNKKNAQQQKPKEEEKFLTAAEIEAQEAQKPAEKPKDAFQALPKGSFDMDEWKRTYSNNDIKSVALPWLWENVDNEHYSFWYCDYSYNDELTMIFMTANLIGGMYQRMEKMRKHAFGSMCIFGENNNNKIHGVWLWRGPNLAFELDGDLQLDYEYYNWRKLDPKSNETDRELVNNYFLQEDGQFGGEKFDQGKIFK